MSKRVPGAACKAVSSTGLRGTAPVRPPPPSPPAVAAAQHGVGHAGQHACPRPRCRRRPCPDSRRRSRRRRRASCRGRCIRYIKDGVRHYTQPARRRAWQRRHGGAHHQVQLHGDLLRLRSAPGRQLRHAAAQHRRLPRGDRRAPRRQFGVEEAIVRAIIHAESAYNPNALSRVGAQGLMQLMPATARRFGVGNAFDASAEHPRRRAVPGLAAQALQRRPDPGRGRLQRRRGRGRQVQAACRPTARPGATSSASRCSPTATAARSPVAQQRCSGPGPNPAAPGRGPADCRADSPFRYTSLVFAAAVRRQWRMAPR